MARLVMLVLALAAVGVAGAGCGRYRRTDVSGAGTTTTAAAVGGGVNLVDSTTTMSGRTTTTTTTKARSGTASATTTAAAGASHAGQATTTTVRDICDGNSEGPPNVTSVDKQGVRLELVVADRLCFDQADGFTMRLRATNRGSQSVYYDSNRYDVFAVVPSDGRATPTWHESDCARNPPQGTPGPPLELEPGETVSFVADYPPKPGTTPESSPCHTLTAGEYAVNGAFRTCPEGSHDRGYCDPARTVDLAAAPLRIRIT